MNEKLRKLACQVLNGEHIEQLPNKDLKIIAKNCGIETAIYLLFEFPGIYLYVPKEKSKILRKIILLSRKRNIEVNELARITGYSLRQIYRILKEANQSDDEE